VRPEARGSPSEGVRMANIEVQVPIAVSSSAPRDAGFWKRALALLIDVCVVTTVVTTAFLLLALAFPDIGKMFTLNTPFGLGTVERTIEDKSTETTDASGTKVTKIDKTIERSILDRWVYRYRIEGQSHEYPSDNFVSSVRTSLSWQIDPATGEPIDTADVDTIAFVLLMLYWILADASRYQGSLGKRLLGLKVVGGQGERLNLATAAGRNLLKILSAIPVLIGFMMAGWTKRKQALHDKITGSYVVAER
jgi:uncharacterized RDD family membrane protein YckC